MKTKVTLIGAPTSAGAHAPGQERTPSALRSIGIVDRLQKAGLDVEDRNDIGCFRWRPDRQNPLAQNLPDVLKAVRALSQQVSEAISEESLCLILGGDCTIEIGTVSASLAMGHRIALIYFDMHADMNVPSSVSNGALDWMGVGHMLGCSGAEPALRDIGPRIPLLMPEELTLFAHQLDQATPFEVGEIARLAPRIIPMERVAQDPRTAALEALTRIPREVDAILVHFDVDVIDFVDAPLSENTGRNIGLSLEEAFQALCVFLADERTRVLTITELNPDHGEENDVTLGRFANGLVAAITGRHQ